jgi:signal transduction histidine kinase
MEDPGWIYRYVFESGAAILVLDAEDLSVLAANPQMSVLTGRRLEELVGGPTDFIDGTEPDTMTDWSHHRTVQIIKPDQDNIAAEVTVLCMERVPKPAVVLRFDPLDDRSNSSPSRLESRHAALQRAHRELQTVYNRHELLIDELNHRNEELKQVYRRLSYASKMAAIGELAAGTTHGINNPLAAAVSANREMSGMADQIAQPHVRKKFEALCSRTDRALKRIEGIVMDMRRLAQAGTRRHDVKQVDLGQEIKLAVDLIGHRLQEVDLEVDLPEGILCRLAPDEFTQVIMNLVDNAVHALAGKGRLAIRIKATVGQAIIEVEDEAGGIPDKIREKIFDPFFSTKDPNKGSGIGLSVARGIIEGYAGSISARSVAGRGTTFEIILPLEGNHDGAPSDIGG